LFIHSGIYSFLQKIVIGSPLSVGHHGSYDKEADKFNEMIALTKQ
jgi:hypothetical protein